MIDQEILGDATEEHFARTDIDSEEDIVRLVRRLGVDPRQFQAMLTSLWEARNSPTADQASAAAVYVGAFLDGFTIGVRAARIEIQQRVTRQ